MQFPINLEHSGPSTIRPLYWTATCLMWQGCECITSICIAKSYPSHVAASRYVANMRQIVSLIVQGPLYMKLNVYVMDFDFLNKLISHSHKTEIQFNNCVSQNNIYTIAMMQADAIFIHQYGHSTK